MPLPRLRRPRPGERLPESDLERLYAVHGRALLAYATRLTGDPRTAEDAVQETLLRAWTHPDSLSPDRGDPRPWLLTVTRNVVRDQHRAQAARPREVGGDALEAVAPTANDDLDRVLQSWLVADSLGALSSNHREVIVETFFRGKSVREVAVSLGIPEGTVKSRTYYALRALKVELEQKGVIS